MGGVAQSQSASLRGKYKCNYMGQITIYLDEKTELLVKRHSKASGQSASRWIAEAVRQWAVDEWPEDIVALLGGWGNDEISEASELRKGYGRDSRREPL